MNKKLLSIILMSTLMVPSQTSPWFFTSITNFWNNTIVFCNNNQKMIISLLIISGIANIYFYKTDKLRKNKTTVKSTIILAKLEKEILNTIEILEKSETKKHIKCSLTGYKNINKYSFTVYKNNKNIQEQTNKNEINNIKQYIQNNYETIALDLFNKRTNEQYYVTILTNNKNQSSQELLRFTFKKQIN